MTTYRFSKYYDDGQEEWGVISPLAADCGRLSFKSKRELMRYYEIKKAVIVDKTFVVTLKGRVRTYMIYEGERAN